jgi:hypothetical protein
VRVPQALPVPLPLCNTQFDGWLTVKLTLWPSSIVGLLGGAVNSRPLTLPPLPPEELVELPPPQPTQTRKRTAHTQESGTLRFATPNPSGARGNNSLALIKILTT